MKVKGRLIPTPTSAEALAAVKGLDMNRFIGWLCGIHPQAVLDAAAAMAAYDSSHPVGPSVDTATVLPFQFVCVSCQRPSASDDPACFDLARCDACRPGAS